MVSVINNLQLLSIMKNVLHHSFFWVVALNSQLSLFQLNLVVSTGYNHKIDIYKLLFCYMGACFILLGMLLFPLQI